MEDINKIGLIAGNGKYPLLFAHAARQKRMTIIAAGIRGDTSFLLRPLVDHFRLFRVGELKSLFDYFKQNNISHVIMAGQVNPANLFINGIPLDDEFRALFQALKDRKADTIFSAIADKLKERDMQLLDSTYLLDDYLAPKGTLTRRGPTEVELNDITFGQQIAKFMGGLDVGQTVVVKERAIVAIEAMEGTDRCILRGGQIARQSAVVVKMSKPKQDTRFDVPVIGPRTIKTMKKCRARCLAIEAGKTLIIDQDACVIQADRSGICIVAA